MASTCFVPIVFCAVEVWIYHIPKSAPKPDQDDVIAPGALIPQLSRVALKFTEEPLAGTGDESESTNF